jgi:diguanylate cyclase (GGDEF)-like protein
MDQEFELNKEPLWAIPAGVKERLRQFPDKGDYDNFKLSVLYSAVAVVFLLLIGTGQIMEGNVQHGVILLGFSATAVVGLATLWLGHWFWMGRHFTAGMMLLLCLYLFYSGGVQNTGPLYYGVYPTVALFLHGRLRGFIWIVALLLITAIVSRGAFGFDVERYTPVFVSRIFFITLIIAVLTCIPEYFRLKAERDLMLSLADLESLSYGDMHTQLANRIFLEKMLQVEFNRNKRYGSDCCLMFIEADMAPKALLGPAIENQHETQMMIVAAVLRKILRVQDVAGRWERRCFLLLLPEISIEGAKQLAERLLTEIRLSGQQQRLGVPSTASIGIAAMDRGDEQAVLKRAMSGLLQARRQGGGTYVAP